MRPGADEAGESDDLTFARTSNDTSLTLRDTLAGRETESRTGGIACDTAGRSGNCASSERPTISRIMSFCGIAAIGARFDRFAVADDGDAIGNARQFFEPVRNVDERDALRFEFRNEREERIGLTIGERRGRFVHHDQSRVPYERFRDLGELLFARRTAGARDDRAAT